VLKENPEENREITDLISGYWYGPHGHDILQADETMGLL
jgi:hypothetical protein